MFDDFGDVRGDAIIDGPRVECALRAKALVERNDVRGRCLPGEHEVRHGTEAEDVGFRAPHRGVFAQLRSLVNEHGLRGPCRDVRRRLHAVRRRELEVEQANFESAARRPADEGRLWVQAAMANPTPVAEGQRVPDLADDADALAKRELVVLTDERIEAQPVERIEENGRSERRVLDIIAEPEDAVVVAQLVQELGLAIGRTAERLATFDACLLRHEVGPRPLLDRPIRPVRGDSILVAAPLFEDSPELVRAHEHPPSSRPHARLLDRTGEIAHHRISNRFAAPMGVAIREFVVGEGALDRRAGHDRRKTVGTQRELGVVVAEEDQWLHPRRALAHPPLEQASEDLRFRVREPVRALKVVRRLAGDVTVPIDRIPLVDARAALDFDEV